MERSPVRVSEAYLKYLADVSAKMKEPVSFIQNRLARYIEQAGVCAVLGVSFHPKDMVCHHVKMKKRNGGERDDRVFNLAWVYKDVHMLIHATNADVIHEYCLRLSLTEEQLKKVNEYRVKLGNTVIDVLS